MECYGKKILLFSVVAEKDYRHMIKLLMRDRIWQEVYIARLDNKRAVPETELEAVFRQYSELPVYTFSDVKEAFTRAAAAKKEKDILFCAGSLYLIGELKEYLEV